MDSLECCTNVLGGMPTIKYSTMFLGTWTFILDASVAWEDDDDDEEEEEEEEEEEDKVQVGARSRNNIVPVR